jgi:hypothetical protein
MSANNSFTNNGAGAAQQPVHTLRVIVDETPGDEALSFAVQGFHVNFSPEDLEVELMAQLGFPQEEATLVARSICQTGRVYLPAIEAFEMFSEHGSFMWPDEDVD